MKTLFNMFLHLPRQRWSIISVFEKDERGGSLVKNLDSEINILKAIAIEGEVDIMKELRASNLLIQK